MGEAELRHALRGVELDERDEKIVEWAEQLWDGPTTAVICGLFEKVRIAGGVDILDLENQIHDKAQEIRNHQGIEGRPVSDPQSVDVWAGNTGPGIPATPADQTSYHPSDVE